MNHTIDANCKGKRGCSFNPDLIHDGRLHTLYGNEHGARQVVYLIMHRKYGFTMKQIGREMGRRHHSTVVHGMRVAEYSLGFKQDKYHLRTKDLWEMVS